MLRFAAVASLAFIAPALAGGSLQFRTPSGNIACEYQPEFENRLYCVRLDPKQSQPEVPVPDSYIVLDKGVAETGPYEGDVWYPDGAPVIAYGKSREFGTIHCESRKTGLSCTRGKHGFSISQKAIKVY